MPKLIDLTRQRFGKFVVVKQVKNNKYGNSRWLCRCDCGNKSIVLGYNLRTGNTKSCGCLRTEVTRKRSTKHGHTVKGKITKTYQAWGDMIKRCTNPQKDSYKYYGGRGIKVCKRWMKFENFLEDMGETPPKHQLDRIKNHKGYHKENCRWVISKINNRNRRDNCCITFKKKTQCIAAWAEEYDISYGTLWARLYGRGWSIARALTIPIRKHKNTRESTGE